MKGESSTANLEHTVSEMKILLPETEEDQRKDDKDKDVKEDSQEATAEDGFGGKTDNVSGEVDKGIVL